MIHHIHTGCGCRGFPTICLTPSYVQNIGTYGAYSRDNKTTATDFVGEYGDRSVLAKSPKRLIEKMICGFSNLLSGWRHLNIVAPLRWGTEWVYESVDRGGDRGAVFFVQEAVDMGWEWSQVADRARRILKCQLPSPVAVRGIRHSLRRTPNAIECHWPGFPNLRERRKYPCLYPEVDPQKLLEALVRDLIPLHEAGIVHNKIRQDNVFLNPNEKSFHLAWYGTEPPHLKKIIMSGEEVVRIFVKAVDKRATQRIRERFANYYLEAVAPEVLEGEETSLRSDVFSVGAVVLLSLMNKEIWTFTQLHQLRGEWAGEEVSLKECTSWRNLRSILCRCVSLNPSNRFKSVLELQKALV